MKTSTLAFIALLICGFIGWSEYTKRNPAERFYGVGSSDTRPFTVKNRWVISWACVGPIKISLVPTGRNSPILVTNTTSPTMASTYQSTGGEYTLHIESSWPWEVSASEVPIHESLPDPVPASAPSNTTNH